MDTSKKNNDLKVYNKEIVSKDDIMVNRLLKTIAGIIILMLIALFLGSCESKKILATSNEGKILTVRDSNYAYSVLLGTPGKADYYHMVSIYFPYPVTDNDKIEVHTKTYLDSLRSAAKR